MKLGKFELTSWSRSYGGWFKYNIDYTSDPEIAICLYHNRIETLHQSVKDPLPTGAVFDPHQPILWTVKFNHIAYELTDLYYSLYEPVEMLEEEIKEKVDNFIYRVDKLIIFT
jgi:predicted DNA-binding helix-hairpin-helix protein